MSRTSYYTLTFSFNLVPSNQKWSLWSSFSFLTIFSLSPVPTTIKFLLFSLAIDLLYFTMIAIVKSRALLEGASLTSGRESWRTKIISKVRENCWRFAWLALTLHLYSRPSRLWLRLWRLVYAGHGQLLPFPTRRWYREKESFDRGALSTMPSPIDTISPEFFLFKCPRDNGINIRYFFKVLKLL